MILKRQLHKFLTLATTMLYLSVSVFAQTKPAKESKCSLTLAQAPEIRGLRLGMTLEQVSNIYPSIKRNAENVLTPNEIGIMDEVNIKSELETDRSKLQGIHQVKLEFMDGRLLMVMVFYDNSITWNSIGEFTNRVSESLTIPNAWEEFRPDYGEGRSLKCEGFKIVVLTGGKFFSATLSLSDMAAFGETLEREIKLPEVKRKKELEEKKRKAETEERKRKEFKP